MKFKQRISLGDKFYLTIQETNPRLTHMIDWQIRGDISPEILRDAWMVTLKRLPPLRSVIRGRDGWFGRLRWEETNIDAAELFEYLDYFQGGKLGPEEAEILFREAYEKYARQTVWDVRKDTPTKMKLVRKGKDVWSILFVGHHAMSDGPATMAVFQFLVDNYSLIEQGKFPPKEPVPQASRSFLRFVIKTSPRKLIATLFAYLRYERMNRPRANTPLVSSWKQKHGTVSVVDLDIERSVTDKLAKRVRDLGISLNEAMILANVRNVYQWLRDRGSTPGKISIAVPVNLRPLAGLKPIESLANYGFTMNINIPASFVEEASRLVHAVRFQSYCLKRLRFHVLWILQTSLYAWLPLKVLKRVMLRFIESGTAVKNAATLVYANMGRLFLDDRGNPTRVAIGSKAHLEGFQMSAPVSYPVAATVAALTYGGRLRVSLSYLDPVLQGPEMEAFLQGFRRELFAVMDEEILMKQGLPPFSEILNQNERTRGQPSGDDSGA